MDPAIEAFLDENRLGFAIGAHTVTHPILSRVGAARARAEIEGSRAAIVASGARPPLAFAYPNGGAADYTPAETALVRETGFACAVTTRFGPCTRTTPPAASSRCQSRPGWRAVPPVYL